MTDPQEGFQFNSEECPVSWCGGTKPPGQALCLRCWHHAHGGGRSEWNEAVREGDRERAREAQEQMVAYLERHGRPSR